ncbi:MAG: hypothetical protein KAR84_08070 [Elusimicrobiales bacterium]|nr:hypothetical protein [Elusimicrobiales bacterium]
MKKNRGKHKHNKNQNDNAQNIISENNAGQNTFQKQEQPVPSDVSGAKVLLFWSIILLLIFLAWLLPKLFNTHEYTVERWLMLGFAAVLGAFLYTLGSEK